MWALKILIKIIISKLPIKYSFWKKVGIFRHGGMDKIEYSKKIFFGHIGDIQKYRKIKKPIILELGPGDGISSAIYSTVVDSPKIYLIDVKPFANKDISPYIDIINTLPKDKSLKFNIKKIKSINDILNELNASYLTDGLSSLKSIKDNSIDYLFSHSVMEHIRFSEVQQTIKEIYRILKPNGIISHNINYKDHLADSLNNLRFPKKIWESDFFANSGFYTNRIPAIEMHNLFKKYNFEFYYENFSSWVNMPIKRRYIDKYFHKYSNKELMNCTSSFIAKKIV